MHLLLFEQLQKTAFFPDVFCDSGDDENIQCQRLVLLSKKKSRQIEVVKNQIAPFFFYIFSNFFNQRMIAIFLVKLKYVTYAKPLHFHEFFQLKNFHNFSRQIEVVNISAKPLHFNEFFN